MASYHTDSSCIFCKIIKGDIPSFKLVDTPSVYSFLDIGPISKGHALVIPKREPSSASSAVLQYIAADECLLPLTRSCRQAARAARLVRHPADTSGPV